MKTPVRDQSNNTNMPNVTHLTMKECTDDNASMNTTEVNEASVTLSQTTSMASDEAQIHQDVTSNCTGHFQMMSDDDKRDLQELENLDQDEKSDDATLYEQDMNMMGPAKATMDATTEDASADDVSPGRAGEKASTTQPVGKKLTRREEKAVEAAKNRTIKQAAKKKKEADDAVEKARKQKLKDEAKVAKKVNQSKKKSKTPKKSADGDAANKDGQAERAEEEEKSKSPRKRKSISETDPKPTKKRETSKKGNAPIADVTNLHENPTEKDAQEATAKAVEEAATIKKKANLPHSYEEMKKVFNYLTNLTPPKWTSLLDDHTLKMPHRTGDEVRKEVERVVEECLKKYCKTEEEVDQVMAEVGEQDGQRPTANTNDGGEAGQDAEMAGMEVPDGLNAEAVATA